MYGGVTHSATVRVVDVVDYVPVLLERPIGDDVVVANTCVDPTCVGYYHVADTHLANVLDAVPAPTTVLRWVLQAIVEVRCTAGAGFLKVLHDVAELLDLLEARGDSLLFESRDHQGGDRPESCGGKFIGDFGCFRDGPGHLGNGRRCSSERVFGHRGLYTECPARRMAERRLSIVIERKSR
jgi:hypothetical protein